MQVLFKPIYVIRSGALWLVEEDVASNCACSCAPEAVPRVGACRPTMPARSWHRGTTEVRKLAAEADAARDGELPGAASRARGEGVASGAMWRGRRSRLRARALRRCDRASVQANLRSGTFARCGPFATASTSHWMGCCALRVMVVDVALHRQPVENPAQADALVSGRVTCEMREAQRVGALEFGSGGGDEV